MEEKKIVVHLQHGLQVRIATKFVEKASAFGGDLKRRSLIHEQE